MSVVKFIAEDAKYSYAQIGVYTFYDQLMSVVKFTTEDAKYSYALIRIYTFYIRRTLGRKVFRCDAQ